MEHAAGSRHSLHSTVDTYTAATAAEPKDQHNTPALLAASLSSDPRMLLATQGPGLHPSGTSSTIIPIKARPMYKIPDSKHISALRAGQAMNSPFVFQGTSTMPSPSPINGAFTMPSQLGMTPFPKFVNLPNGVWIRDGDNGLDSPGLTPDSSDMYQDPMDSHSATFNAINPFRFSNQHQTFNSGLIDARRMSVSTTSMSSAGPREEYSVSDSAYASDVDWSATEAQAQHMFSPLVSPQLQQPEMTRATHPYRTSPNVSGSVRASPYTTETNRTKRWSTGAYNPMGGNRPAGFYAHRFSYQSPSQASRPFSHNPHADLQPINFPPPQVSPQFAPHDHSMNSPLFPQPMFSSLQQFFPEPLRPLPSQSRYPFTPGTMDSFRHRQAHLADFSDPPNLYASLTEEPSDPPESDMNPEDPDMIPHQQDLRFSGDLYTPKWVRGHGNKREGWCGLCKPGRWLVLKNSAFWYDKSFTHGVSAASGAAFQGPLETRRTDGNPDVWEGHCGNCGDWVALVSSKKKGTTWFRHAYKCHTHTKVKEGPKRRRNTESTPRVPSPRSPQTASSLSEVTVKPTKAEGSEMVSAGSQGQELSHPCESACCSASLPGSENQTTVQPLPVATDGPIGNDLAVQSRSAMVSTVSFNQPPLSAASHGGFEAQHMLPYGLSTSGETQDGHFAFVEENDYAMYSNPQYGMDSGLGLIFDGRPFGQTEMMPCTGTYY